MKSYILKPKFIKISQINEKEFSLSSFSFYDVNFKNDNIKKVNEFKSKEEITYRELEKFYIRIKEKPKEFLSSLSHKIYQDIYEFDNNKIIQKYTFICKEIANASDCTSLTKTLSLR